MTGVFRLLKSETLPLTREFAAEFASMEASPTERELNAGRLRHLAQKAAEGRLIAFQWAVAHINGHTVRVNGQTSGNMLNQLDGSFPDGLVVHLDEYEVDDEDGLAELFRQFDDRRSSRSPADVAGAYQGLEETLRGVPRTAAKTGIEGVVWYRAQIIGMPLETAGDNLYRQFHWAPAHPFLNWFGGLLSASTPELRRKPVVGAIYGTWETSGERLAGRFWADVAGGAIRNGDAIPQAIVLDEWLTRMADESKRVGGRGLKPTEYYQGCIYAWNAYRDDRQIPTIKHDVKKGLLDIRE